MLNRLRRDLTIHPWSVLLPALVGWALSLRHANVFEPDMFLHTLLGQRMLSGGSPAGDPAWVFGPHAADTWQNTLIVPELIFALLYRVAGWGGLALVPVLARAGILVTAWVALVRLQGGPRANRNRWSNLLVPVVSVFLAYNIGMTIRPQTLSYVLAPLFTVTIVRTLYTGRFPRPVMAFAGTWLMSLFHGYALLVAPVLLVAAGVHVLSDGLTAGAGARRAAFRSALLRVLTGWRSPVAMLAATLATPAGFGIYLSAARIREAATAVVSEWQPLGSKELVARLLMLLVAVWLVAVLVQLRRHKTDGRILLPRHARREIVAELLMLVALFAMFAPVRRTALLLVIPVMVLAAGRWLRGAAAGNRSGKVFRPLPRPLWAATSVALAVGLLSVAVELPRVTISEYLMPSQLVAKMQQVPGAHRVFVGYDVSSAILFQLVQHDRDHGIPAPLGSSVSIDGRTDRYGADILTDYEALSVTDVGWEARWKPYASATDVIVVEGTAISVLLYNNGWQLKGEQDCYTTSGVPVRYAWLTPPAGKK